MSQPPTPTLGAKHGKPPLVIQVDEIKPKKKEFDLYAFII